MRYRLSYILIYIIIGGILSTMNVFADDKYKPYPNFQIPPEYETVHEYHPAVYLENYPVKNINKKLSKEERARLGYLIIVSDQVCKKKYNQSYFLETKSQIFKLIVSNFPSVKKLRAEDGSIVPLWELAKFFKKLPEVQSLVNKNQTT